ncbi:MAG TPA: hypothetical protein VMZ04_01260 [Anaerolineae bacterium]|nr:hypothetical protein [Anaerolineae bacterium]
MKSPLIAFTLGICFFLFSVIAEGQETTPELKLEEYRIIGKDTRVFTIAGDRYSTVEFITVPLSLPEEIRSIETSQGLIGSEERLRREEVSEIIIGPYLRADIFSGSRTLADVWGKGSLDMGDTAATVHIINRMAKENTRTNTAPLSQEIEAVGYYDASEARVSAEAGFAREDDNLFDERFRHRNRKAGRFWSGLTVRTVFKEKWDVTGKGTMSVGSYRDLEIDTHNNEFLTGGIISAQGDLYDITMVLCSSAEYLKLGSEAGSIFSLGVKGELLLWHNLGFQTGANFYASALPNEDPEVHLYPELSLDWAISRSSYVKITLKPAVIRHSYSDLYASNGLLIPVPMLFENRKLDITGEIGLRVRSGFTISAGIFYMQSENTPVFSRSGDLFSVVKDTELDVTGVRLKTIWDRDETMGFSGELTITNAQWNLSGEIPYLPVGEAVASGYFIPYRQWTVHGSLSFMSKHYIETGLDDTIDWFVTLNCGVERELREYLCLYINIENITNSQRSWWTSQYKIPGIGLYAGLKTEY